MFPHQDFGANNKNDNGWTQIHHSAKNGYIQKIEFLADMGANIHLKTNDGKNCLHIAAANGYLNLCKVLTDKHNFDVYTTDNYGWTALHYSAESGTYELIKLFIEKGPDVNLKTKNGENCLHIAAGNGHFDVCETLTNKHKFDVNMTNHKGWTALHTSAQNGSYELIKLFIDKGAYIYLKTSNGDNCLHIAAGNGHLNLCKILINKHKFDVDMANSNGRTALHFSAQNGSYELIKLFIDKGADIHLKTKTGNNCLHIAACNKHLNLCKALLDIYNFDVHMTNSEGWTALHFSAGIGNYELFQLFMDKGGDLDLKTKNEDSCLHIAAGNGHLNLCRTLLGMHKFDVDMTNNYGITSLHLSAGIGSYELIKLFIEKGADIHLKTKNGNNCLHIAAYNGDLNLCRILLDMHNFDVYMTNNR